MKVVGLLFLAILAEGAKPEQLGLLLGTSVGVKLVNYPNTTTKVPLMTYGTVTVDYHLAKNLVFAHSGGKLYRSKVNFNGTTRDEPTLIRNETYCFGFTVDWVHDKIYWANHTDSDTTVMVMDLDGKNVMPILKEQTGKLSINRMVVDPYKRRLFWTIDEKNTIASCSLSGKHYHTFKPSSGKFQKYLALDLEKQRVFFMGENDNSTTNTLYSTNYRGRDFRSHFSLKQFVLIDSLIVLRGVLYWVNYENNTHIIYKAPLEVSGNFTVQSLYVEDKWAFDLKVIHPDLQRPLLPGGDLCKILSECSQPLDPHTENVLSSESQEDITEIPSSAIMVETSQTPAVVTSQHETNDSVELPGEDEETKWLSTALLQRKLLLKQLELAELQVKQAKQMEKFTTFVLQRTSIYLKEMAEHIDNTFNYENTV